LLKMTPGRGLAFGTAAPFIGGPNWDRDKLNGLRGSETYVVHKLIDHGRQGRRCAVASVIAYFKSQPLRRLNITRQVFSEDRILLKFASLR